VSRALHARAPIGGQEEGQSVETGGGWGCGREGASGGAEGGRGVGGREDEMVLVSNSVGNEQARLALASRDVDLDLHT